MLIKFIQPDFNFKDERGSLTQLVHDGWKQINYITSVAGSFRGDHYHIENSEAFYIISGSLKLSLYHNETGEKAEYNIKTGDFFIIYPNVVHSFDYKEDTTLISLYDKGVELPNSQKDIQK